MDFEPMEIGSCVHRVPWDVFCHIEYKSIADTVDFHLNKHHLKSFAHSILSIFFYISISILITKFKFDVCNRVKARYVLQIQPNNKHVMSLHFIESQISKNLILVSYF